MFLWAKNMLCWMKPNSSGPVLRITWYGLAVGPYVIGVASMATPRGERRP